MLFVALKDRKSVHDDNEGKSTFHAIETELSKQPKNVKEQLRLVICSFRVGTVSNVPERLTDVSFGALNTFQTSVLKNLKHFCHPIVVLSNLKIFLWRFYKQIFM